MSKKKTTTPTFEQSFNDVLTWLEEAKLNADISDISNFLKSEVDEFLEGSKNKDFEEMYDGIADILVVTFNLVYRENLSIEKVKQKLACVIASNNSKFCLNEIIANETVQLYERGEHPDKLGKVIHAYAKKLHQNAWGVFRIGDDKILKSHLYKDPMHFKNDFEDGRDFDDVSTKDLLNELESRGHFASNILDLDSEALWVLDEVAEKMKSKRMGKIQQCNYFKRLLNTIEHD